LVDLAGFTSADKFHSQGGEDEYAWKNFFHNIVGGSYMEVSRDASRTARTFWSDMQLHQHKLTSFVLQVGAMDGRIWSNSYWFHRNLAWRGLLIEGSPGSYSSLKVSRPVDLRVHAALCANITEVHWMTGNANEVQGIFEFMSEKYRNTWYPHQDGSRGIPIKCLPLGEILKFLRIHHIDFFSLDVEGGEVTWSIMTDSANAQLACSLHTLTQSQSMGILLCSQFNQKYAALQASTIYEICPESCSMWVDSLHVDSGASETPTSLL
jgi:hypothetical protein